MDKNKVEQFINSAMANLVEARNELHSTPAQTIKAGENLASYLEKPGEYNLEAGATFEAQGFLLKPGTKINGNGARLHGQNLAALTIPIESKDFFVDNLTLTSENSERAFQIGENGPNQNSLDKVPSLVRLHRLKFPSYRGKNCIENNGTVISFVDLEITDHYHPGGVESHGIVSINTPGKIAIRGGTYHGSSIPFLFGGDEMDLELPTPIERIEDIVIDGVYTEVPPEWRLTGKKIKTRLEFKNAHNVKVLNFTGRYSYADGQAGYGALITPTRDGSCSDIYFENLNLLEVGGGILSTGIDKREKTTGIRIKKFKFLINTKYGGTEWAFHLQRDYGTFDVEDGEIFTNGTALLRLDTPTLERFSMRGVTAPVGKYGIQVLGVHTNLAPRTDNLNIIIEDNTFSGASEQFKKNWPKNFWKD